MNLNIINAYSFCIHTQNTYMMCKAEVIHRLVMTEKCKPVVYIKFSSYLTIL